MYYPYGYYPYPYATRRPIFAPAAPWYNPYPVVYFWP